MQTTTLLKTPHEKSSMLSNLLTCLSRLRFDEIVTPRRRMCSLAVTAPSRKPGPQPARSERLCFAPSQGSSVLSVLSFRQFADIQWPMSVMQSSSRAAVEAVSRRLQCTYSYESSAYAWKLTPCWSISSARSPLANVQNEQSRTKH